MDIEDSLIEFIKDLLRGGCIFKRNEMSVRGKSVHNDHDSCGSIGFVEWASEVYGEGLIGFVRCRESVTNQPPLQVFVTGIDYLTIIGY